MLRVFFVFTLLVGCDDTSNTALSINLRTDFIGGRDFSGVQINVGEGDLRTRYDHNYSTLIDYFRGARIAEVASTDAGEQTIEVVLLRDGVELISRTASVLLAEGQRTNVTVVITRDCSGIMCPSVAGSPLLSACLGGRCEDPRCTVETPEFCQPGECASDGDCAITGCQQARCVTNVCLVGPDDSQCGSGLVCDVEAGCIPAGVDAGPPGDAGPPDAGPPADAGPPTDAGPPADTGASTLALDDAQVNVNTSGSLVARGGMPPYAYSVMSGDLTLGSETGEFTAPPFTQVVRVSVTDMAGVVVNADLMVGGTNLYYIAGRDAGGTPTDSVFRSEDDGETWTQIGTLPERNYNGGLIVYENTMLWMGGRPGSWSSAVWQSANGVDWTQIGDLPEARASIHPMFYDGRLWVAGGYNAMTHGDVWASDDGGVSWESTGSLPITLHAGALVPKDGRLFYVGGLDEEPILEEHDDVWVTTDGAAWTELTDVMPSPCYGASVIVDRDRLLLAGGSEPCDGILESLDGMTWTVLGPMPAPRSKGRLIRHQGSIVYAAGDENDMPTSDVWLSEDASDWRLFGNLPEPRVGGGLVTFTPDTADTL